MDFLPIHTIFFLVCWSLGLVPFCASDSRLLPNKPLSAGNTLISDDGTFALGFFSLSNSTTKHYYVGIWYNNILPRTVVWVANRGIPIMDNTTAKLTLTSDSDLVLSNTDGHVLWTTNTSGNSLPTTGANAILDHTGNFILRSSIDDTVIWQSFDYPTDTLLPPWKNPQDPSPGNFSFGAYPNSIFQRFVWNGSRPYWRTPILPSYLEILNSTLYMSVHRRDDEFYISFGMSSGSMAVLFKLDYSGLLKLLIWDSNVGSGFRESKSSVKSPCYSLDQ